MQQSQCAYHMLMFMQAHKHTHLHLQDNLLYKYSQSQPYRCKCIRGAVGFCFSGPEMNQCGKAVCAESTLFFLPLCTSSCLVLSSKTLPSDQRRWGGWKVHKCHRLPSLSGTWTFHVYFLYSCFWQVRLNNFTRCSPIRVLSRNISNHFTVYEHELWRGRRGLF